MSSSLPRTGARTWPTERSLGTRTRLLEAAAACLAEYGYARTSTTLICQRAGLSRGAQLHHFPAKWQLLLESVTYLAQRRNEETRARAHLAAQTGQERSVQAGIAFLWGSFSGQAYDAFMELWHAARLDPELRDELRKSSRAMGRLIHELCDEMFPTWVTSAPWYDDAFDTVVYLMRGTALTRVLKDDPEEEARVLKVCERIISGQLALTGVAAELDGEASDIGGDRGRLVNPDS